MVKTPRTRHSRTERERQTIDLAPDEISRLDAEEAAVPDSETVLPPDLPVDGTATSTTEPNTSNDSGTAPSEKEYESVETSEPKPGNRTQDAAFSTSAQVAAKPSRGSALSAGVAGGIIALAAAGALQFAGLLGAPGATPEVAGGVSEQVAQEIAGLRSQIDSLKSATPPDIDGISGEVQALSQALDALRTEVTSLKQASESGGAGNTAAVDALDSKISHIESQIVELTQRDDTVDNDQISALGERIASAETLAHSTRETMTGLATRLGALEQSVTTLSGKVEAQSGQPRIALAIAASALKSAIERGAPFQSEIETLAAIAPDAPGLAELRRYAEKGVATRADLIAQTDVAARSMIAAANPPPADAGIFERLISSAESLVSVRPIGAVEGTGTPEIVARMEVALKAGDLSQAVAEYDTLPDAAKTAGAAFADSLKARLSVEQLADQAITAAMQAA